MNAGGSVGGSVRGGSVRWEDDSSTSRQGSVIGTEVNSDITEYRHDVVDVFMTLCSQHRILYMSLCLWICCS